MELKNTTDFEDWFIRRMISWVCKSEYIDWSVKKINKVIVRNRNRGRYSGRAWPWARRIVLSIGTARVFSPYIRDEHGHPIRDEEAIKKGRPLHERFKVGEPDLDERIKLLVELTAHEVGHLTQIVKPRRRGKYSEREVDWKADRVVEDFLEKREELIAAWGVPPVYATKPKKVQPTAQEQRYARTLKNLANWEKKSKLAATKLKKYRKQIRYYEKALGVDAEAAKKGK